jgi:iron(III) transport system ATP-binding protein
MSSAITIRQLGKTYEGASQASVAGVSFDVAPGEIIALLGPSGCGKTTTLRCIAGLEQPTEGSIRVGHEVFSSAAEKIFLPPQQRRLGMVFQSYAVWPHLDVGENVAYPLKRLGFDAATRRQKVVRALELVGLDSHARRPINTLSGGQLQRVALARSLVYEPSLLLLDEPLSNLDAGLRVRLREDLRSIIKRVGLTAIFVTHDQSEAIGIADRIAVMRDGRLLQIDTPVNLYNRPADAFVAGFTGAANSLPATVVSVEGTGERGIAAMGGERLAITSGRPLQAGQAVDIVLRPENVRLLAPGLSPRPGSLAAVVQSRHYQGDHTEYVVTLGGGEALRVRESGSVPRFADKQAVRLVLPDEGGWALPSQASAASRPAPPPTPPAPPPALPTSLSSQVATTIHGFAFAV